jgi:tryptophan halogenase
MNGAPRQIVIVGRDAALWLTATVLRHALAPAGVSVTAVELPTRLSASSAYPSLPPLEALHARLGLDESALLRTTGGSFSLGNNVVGPAGTAPFFLAHGSYGAPIDGTSFFSYWVKARHFGLGAALEDFCPTAMAARQGRMLLPDEATEAFGRTDYSYHLPALAYVAALKARASRLGIGMHHARSLAVKQQSGAISEITLEDGTRIAGDLFVDTSGTDAVLIGQLGEGCEDWQPIFAANRSLTAHAVPFAQVPAYSEIRIGGAGWLALHASQATTHITYAFASDLQDDEAALGAAQALSGLKLLDPVLTPIKQGRRDRAWSANCVAIGGGACAFDPVFDMDLHAIQLGIVHLLSLLPISGAFDAERSEYNRVTRSAFERLRDFQSAFYALNRFGAAGFWAKAREAAPPPEVAHKIAIFRARGDIAPMEDETFAQDLWQALFVGLGEMPESWPPAIDRTPPQRMKEEFRRILGFVKDKVLEQPTHDSYLRGLCRSEAA